MQNTLAPHRASLGSVCTNYLLTFHSSQRELGVFGFTLTSSGTAALDFI